MKVVVVFLGLALLFGVACSRREAGAPPLLDESAPYETTRAAGAPTLEPGTLPAVTPSPTISPPTSPPTKRPSPAPPPTPTPDEVVGEAVPFLSIAKGEAGSRRLDVFRPTLEVVGSTDELEGLIRWNRPRYVPRQVREGLQGIDPDATWVVGAFSESKPTNGHGISIQEVTLDEGQVSVTVHLTSPLPGHAAAAVQTHPYHLVAISRDDLAVLPGTRWSMVTKDGKVLAETVYPPVPTVPFFSIAKGAAGSPRLDVGRGPALEIVRDSGDLEALIRWNRPGYVPRRVKEGLQGIQPLATWVVVAYSGSTATDGHEIAIQEVRLDEGKVRVTVVIRSPGQVANDVMTHPYHVIGISKQDMFVPSEVNWLMVTEDGTVLAETSADRIAHPQDPVVTPDATVPFKSISKGYSLSFRTKEPTLLVSSVEEGSSRFSDRFEAVTGLDDIAIKRYLPPLGPGAEWTAVVLLGIRSSGGYGISVVNVSVAEGHIRLTVVVTSPLPRQAVVDAQIHPYHVVVMADEDIVSPPGTRWSMVTKDGKVLAETVYPAE